MKFRIFTLLVLVLGVVSCYKSNELGTHINGEVDVQLAVNADGVGSTRAGKDGASDTLAYRNSALGAIDYLQATDWADADLRYTLEVYDVDKSGVYGDSFEPIKDRQVMIVDSYEPVVFDLRLAPSRDYHFVVFADFVEEGSAELSDKEKLLLGDGLHHRIGATLKDISVIEDAINDETTDAYFATKNLSVSNSGMQDIVLRRPYGKVRVIATDLADVNINIDPKSVKVTYTAEHPNRFNALTGAIDTESTVLTYEAEYVDDVRTNMDKHIYNHGYEQLISLSESGNPYHSHMTLFTDYILAEEEPQPIHFTMEVFDESDRIIKSVAFSTDIPLQRNRLTTIIGNVLTTATTVDVCIDDNFADKITVDDEGNIVIPDYDDDNQGGSGEGGSGEGGEGGSGEGPGSGVTPPDDDDDDNQDGEGDNTDPDAPKLNAQGSYVITNVKELTWVATKVNSGETFNGKKFIVANNIDLENEHWTPIGVSATSTTPRFEGEFDGQSFAIMNMVIDVIHTRAANTNKYLGLFGCTSGYIHDLKLSGIVVNGETYRGKGALAGEICPASDGTPCRVENVFVDNAELTGNGWMGGVVGVVYGNLSNCDSANVMIVSTPDQLSSADIYYHNGNYVGGVAGLVGEGSYLINGCDAADFDISAYSEIGGVIGAVSKDNIVKNISATRGVLTANWTKFVEVKPVYTCEVIGKEPSNALVSNDTYNDVEIRYVNVVKVPDYDEPTNTYMLRTTDDLVYFSKAEIEPGVTLKLMKDIDFTGVEFTGINPYRDVTQSGYNNYVETYRANPVLFDGNHHTVRNLTIDEFNEISGVGFINLWVGDIKDLNMENVTISSTKARLGAVASFLYGDIDNVHVTNANISSKHQTVAALVARHSDGNITNCSVKNSTFYGRDANAGAMVGIIYDTSSDRLYKNITVENCVVKYGASAYKNQVGAFVGEIAISGKRTITFENCTATGIKGNSDKDLDYVYGLKPNAINVVMTNVTVNGKVPVH